MILPTMLRQLLSQLDHGSGGFGGGDGDGDGDVVVVVVVVVVVGPFQQSCGTGTA